MTKLVTLVYRKKFIKSFTKLSKKHRERAMDVIDIFELNTRDKSLRRHKLKGKYKDYESIDVTGDIRIIIQPQTREIIDICDVGSHSQLY